MKYELASEIALQKYETARLRPYSSLKSTNREQTHASTLVLKHILPLKNQPTERVLNVTSRVPLQAVLNYKHIRSVTSLKGRLNNLQNQGDNQYITLPTTLNQQSSESLQSIPRKSKKNSLEASRFSMNQYLNQNSKIQQRVKVQNHKDQSVSNSASGQITISDITPELAAQIVRHHILPMFDSNPSMSKNSLKSGQVYNELKLTDILENELTQVRAQIKSKIESLELAEQQVFQQKKQIATLKSDNNTKETKIRKLNSRIKQIQAQKQQEIKIIHDELYRREAIDQFLEQQQIQMDRINRDYHSSKIECDEVKNLNSYLVSEQKLLRLQHEVLKQQAASLFIAIRAFPTIKILQDRLSVKNQDKDQEKAALLSQFEQQREFLTECLKDRDESIQSTKDLNEKFMSMEARKNEMYKSLRESVTRLEHELLRKTDENANLQNLIQKLESARISVEKQVVHLTKRLQRLKKTRVNVDSQKTCKQCGVDYIESENFNWSCRTHKSQYSGDIWWCCGKQSEEAVGCKFDRHIAKAFNQDEEEVFNAFMQASRKNEVCKCCKEIGHSAERCDNDPNFHTTKSNLEEMELQQMRIDKITNKKRYYGHSLIQTTHFLKKCAIQKAKDQTRRSISQPVGEQGGQSVSNQVISHPFKRGAMAFEDYNYSSYNQFVLVENKDGEIMPQNSEHQKLSEKVLKQIDQFEYQQEAMLGQREESESDFKGKTGWIEVSSSSSSDLADQSPQKSSSAEHTKLDQVVEEVMKPDVTVSNEETVYFKKWEINALKKKQNQDTFKDLIRLKSDSSRSSLETKFEIKEFFKIDKKDNGKQSKQKKKNRRVEPETQQSAADKLTLKELMQEEKRILEKQKAQEKLEKQQQAFEKEKMEKMTKLEQVIQEIINRKAQDFEVEKSKRLMKQKVIHYNMNDPETKV